MIHHIQDSVCVQSHEEKKTRFDFHVEKVWFAYKRVEYSTFSSLFSETGEKFDDVLRNGANILRKLIKVVCFHNRTLHRRNFHSTEKTEKRGEVLFYGKQVFIFALLDDRQSAFAWSG